MNTRIVVLAALLVSGAVASQERAATAGEAAAGIKHTPTFEEQVRKRIEQEGAKKANQHFPPKETRPAPAAPIKDPPPKKDP